MKRKSVKATMAQRRASALLMVLLVAFPLIAPAEADTQQDTRLYYNREGGLYYHTDPKCQLIHPTYHPNMASFPLRELDGHRSLTPCPMCTADFPAYWFGEAEARAAAESLGEMQVIAWKITPEKDRIWLLLLDGIGSISETTLARVGDSWAEQAADTKDSVIP